MKREKLKLQFIEQQKENSSLRAGLLVKALFDSIQECPDRYVELFFKRFGIFGRGRIEAIMLAKSERVCRARIYRILRVPVGKAKSRFQLRYDLYK